RVYVLCFVLCFLFYNTTTDCYNLSLHDALPISAGQSAKSLRDAVGVTRIRIGYDQTSPLLCRLQKFSARVQRVEQPRDAHIAARSEEHTSELQSRFDLVCRLLLEKKKVVLHR